MADYVTCQACGYARGDECANPACRANPSLSDKRRAGIVAAQDKAQADADERAMIRRARQAASTGR